MSDIAIIGAGKLGTHLGYALSRIGHRIIALSDSTLQQARQSQELIGEGEYGDDNSYAAQNSQWIILTVPDDAIERVAEELACADIDWQNKFVFHCSGLLSTGCLIPLEKKGAWIASIHPAQSFSDKKPDSRAFQGIFFGLEGKGKALQLAIEITQQLGARHVLLQGQNKPLYHLACSMASNFMATLLDLASDLLKKAGLDDFSASQLLMSLVQGTLQNVKKFDAGHALTGPVARGDEATIAMHLDALQTHPGARTLYIQMTKQSLQIVKRDKKLSAEKIKALETLLEGK
jgi:predicted short-subunit dehydrogenase-like oxidoreductase (DUF2520 family)